MPEGIAYDPVSRAFFVGSLRHRKILRRSAGGAWSDFVPEGRDGLLAVVALAADPARRLLWACTSAVPSMRGWAEGDEGLTAVFAYELDSGKLVRKIYPEVSHGAHVPGGIAVGPSGDVFLSDGIGGGLSLISAGEDRSRIFVAPGEFRSPRGLAVSEDGRELFVADFLDGLWRVDAKTGGRRAVLGPRGSERPGMEGLLRSGRALIATFPRDRPPRIVRLDLSPAEDRIVRETVLARDARLLSEPAPGTAAEGGYFTVANAPWKLFDPEAKPAPPETFPEPSVVRVPLGS